MKRLLILSILLIASIYSFGQYQEILNGESGLSVRTKLNTMHSQLYDLNLTAEFSANGTSWHDEYTGGDLFIRFSSDLGVTFSQKLYLFDGVNFVDSLNLNNKRVTNIATAINAKDAINLQQLNDSLDNVFLQGQPIDSLMFSTDIANLVHQEGKLYYDSIRGTLNFYNAESDIMLNIGEELWSPIVHNHTGATIGNGKVVYISGSDANNIPDIRLADKDSLLTSRILGVTTHEIENDGTGRVTWFGYVSGNFSAFTKGELLYLSDAGELTETQPTDGAYVITIGRVIDNSVDGKIFVSPLIAEHTAEVDDVKGWPQTNKPTITFRDSNRYLKVAPSTGNTYYYYQSGVKYISVADSIQIADTEGLHVFYYNAGTLTTIANPTAAQTENIIRNYPVVAYVYWNATANKAIYTATETHTIGLINGTIHAILHFNFGAQYQSGLTPTSVVTNGDGSSNTHAQFGIDAGGFTDEDLYQNILAVASTTGIPLYYKSGSGGAWRDTLNTGYAFTQGATPLPQYNQYTGGQWRLQEVTSGNFILVHIFAVNDNSRKLWSIAGEAEYSTLTLAQDGAANEILDIQLAGLPGAEIIPIATFVLEGKTTFTNSVNARYRVATATNDDYIDWRFSNLVGAGGAGGTGTPATTAAAVTYDNSTSGLTAANVQDAIDEIVSGVTTYTDEKAQDAVGGILSNAGGVTFTYNDATPSITASFTEADGAVTNEKNTSALFNETTKVFSITDPQGTVSDTIEGFLITEVDPIFAEDSAKLIHWGDTINKIATQHDLTGYVSGSGSNYYIQNQTASNQVANARIAGYFDATSFKEDNTELKLNKLKVGSLGTTGQFAVGAGASSDFVWTSPASINVSSFNNDANYVTAAASEPLFIADSAKILHWSDTLNIILTQTDIINSYPTLQQVTDKGNTTNDSITTDGLFVTTRTKLLNNGTMQIGQAADAINITWNTGKGIINAMTGKSLVLGANNSTAPGIKIESSTGNVLIKSDIDNNLHALQVNGQISAQGSLVDTLPTHKKWALFGDSFSDLITDEYGEYVIEKLGFTGAISFGYPGNRMQHQLDTLKNLLTAHPDTLDYFDILSLLVGVNDFSASTAIGNKDSEPGDANYAGRLKEFIETALTANPLLEIYIMTPPETNTAGLPYGFVNSSGWSLNDLAILINDICTQYSVNCIDLYTLSGFNEQTISTYTLDNLHPNAAGVKAIGKVVANAFVNKNSSGVRKPTLDPYDEINTAGYNLNGVNITTPGTLGNVAYKGTLSDGYLPFYQSSSTSLQNSNIKFSGQSLGINTAVSSGIGLYNTTTALTGTAQTGIFSYTVGTTEATSSIRAFASLPATAAGVFTVSGLYGMVMFDAVKGSGSTIGAQYGLHVLDLTTGSNNYGISSAVTSGTNKWNLHISGTANNYLNGNTGIGINLPTEKLDVNGNARVRSVGTGTAVNILGVTSDGTLTTNITNAAVNWNTAYTDRNKWDGGATGLNVSTAFTTLGATTLGKNFFQIATTSTLGYPQINSDNSISQLTASQLRTAIGAGTGSGSVTSVAMTVPTGLSISGTPITTSGTLALTLTSGYSIPTTASQTNWNTAYSWGNHSSAGYLTSDANYAKLNDTNTFTANQTVSKSSPAFYIKSSDASLRKLEFLNSSGTGQGNVTSQIDGSLDIQGSADIEINAGSGNNFKVTGSNHFIEGLASGTQTKFVGYNTSNGEITYQEAFPSAGIALSTGTGWGTSITNNSSNWNTAYGWGNHASAGYLTSEVDGSISNEGTLSVSAGTASTSLLNTNTSGGNFVTFAAGSGMAISETVSGNGGTITFTNNSPNLLADLSYSGSSSPITLNSSDGTDVTFVAGTNILLSATSSAMTIGLPTSITLSGTATATNFILSSDRRLKNNIQPLTNIKWMDDIHFKSFYFNNDLTGKLRYGVIAQEVEKVNPNLVITDEKGYKSVSYIDLLITKVARQDEIINELLKRIEKLENEK